MVREGSKSDGDRDLEKEEGNSLFSRDSGLAPFCFHFLPKTRPLRRLVEMSGNVKLHQTYMISRLTIDHTFSQSSILKIHKGPDAYSIIII